MPPVEPQQVVPTGAVSATGVEATVLQQVVAGTAALLQQVVPQLEDAGRNRATTLNRRLLQQVPQVLLQVLQAGAAQVVHGAGAQDAQELQCETGAAHVVQGAGIDPQQLPQRLRREIRTRRVLQQELHEVQALQPLVIVPQPAQGAATDWPQPTQSLVEEATGAASDASATSGAAGASTTASAG